MFTGIIEAIGTVVSVEPCSGDMRLHIATGALNLEDVALGDSIAANGCCLTVVDLPGDGYIADVSTETLRLTTLQHWGPGARVNLEKSLTPRTRLGGHLVSGHVDGIGEVIGQETSARAEVFWLRAPWELARYIAHKGSIAIDGTSLTVNAVNGNEFCLTVIPHTLRETIMDGYRPGVQVNVEVDLIARHLERLMSADIPVNAESETNEPRDGKGGIR